MRNVCKRALPLLLAVCLLFTLLPLPASALITDTEYPFADASNHWAANQIEEWAIPGVLLGHDGHFRPNDPITRAELAAVINRVMRYQTAGQNSFSDLSSAAWYYQDVLKLSAAGILQGHGGLVRPEDSITREETAAVFARAFRVEENTGANTKFSDAASISVWAKPLVFGMEAAQYIQGSGGAFRPGAPITRAEVVTILDNMVRAYYHDVGSQTGKVTGNVLVNTPGVTLKNMTIEGNLYLASGIADGDITLDGVVVFGKTIVLGSKNLTVTGDSRFTFMDVCRAGPVSIHVTGAAKTAFAAQKPQTGLSMTESGGVLNVTAQNVVLDLRVEEIASVPAPLSGGSGGSSDPTPTPSQTPTPPAAPTAAELSVTPTRELPTASDVGSTYTQLHFSGTKATAADIARYEMQVGDTANPGGVWLPLTAADLAARKLLVTDARQKIFLRVRAGGNVPAGLPTAGVVIGKENVVRNVTPAYRPVLNYEMETLIFLQDYEYGLGVDEGMPVYNGTVYGEPVAIGSMQYLYLRYRETEKLPASAPAVCAFPPRAPTPDAMTGITLSPGMWAGYVNIIRPDNTEMKIVTADANVDTQDSRVRLDWFSLGSVSGVEVHAAPGDKIYIRTRPSEMEDHGPGNYPGYLKSLPSGAKVITAADIKPEPTGVRPPAPTAEELSFTLSPGSSDWTTTAAISGSKAGHIFSCDIGVGFSPDDAVWERITSYQLGPRVTITVTDARHSIFFRLPATNDTPASEPTAGVLITKANVKPGAGPSAVPFVDYIAETVSIPSIYEYSHTGGEDAVLGSGAPMALILPSEYSLYLYLRVPETEKLPASSYKSTQLKRPAAPFASAAIVTPGSEDGKLKIELAANLEFTIVKSGTGANATGADVVVDWTPGNPSGTEVSASVGDDLYLRVAATATSFKSWAALRTLTELDFDPDYVPRPPAPTAAELTLTLSPSTTPGRTAFSFSGTNANQLSRYEYQIGDQADMDGSWRWLGADLISLLMKQVSVTDARHKVFLRLRATETAPAGYPTEGVTITKANVSPGFEPYISPLINYKDETITIPFIYEYSFVSAETLTTGNGNTLPLTLPCTIYLRTAETEKLPASLTGENVLARPAAPDLQELSLRPGDYPGTVNIAMTLPYPREIKIGADSAWMYASSFGMNVPASPGDILYFRVAALGSTFRSEATTYVLTSADIKADETVRPPAPTAAELSVTPTWELSTPLDVESTYTQLHFSGAKATAADIVRYEMQVGDTADPDGVWLPLTAADLVARKLLVTDARQKIFLRVRADGNVPAGLPTAGLVIGKENVLRWEHPTERPALNYQNETLTILYDCEYAMTGWDEDPIFCQTTYGQPVAFGGMSYLYLRYPETEKLPASLAILYRLPPRAPMPDPMTDITLSPGASLGYVNIKTAANTMIMVMSGRIDSDYDETVLPWVPGNSVSGVEVLVSPGDRVFVRTLASETEDHGHGSYPGYLKSLPSAARIITAADIKSEPTGDRPPAPTAAELSFTLAKGSSSYPIYDYSTTSLTFTGTKATAADIGKYEMQVGDAADPDGVWTPLLTLDLIGKKLAVTDARHKIFLRLRSTGDTPAGEATAGVVITKPNVSPGKAPDYRIFYRYIDYFNETITIPYEFEENRSSWPSVPPGTAVTMSFKSTMYLRYRETDALPASYVNEMSTPYYPAPNPNGLVTLAPGAAPNTVNVKLPPEYEFEVLKYNTTPTNTGSGLYGWLSGDSAGTDIVAVEGWKIHIRKLPQPASEDFTKPGHYLTSPSSDAVYITDDDINLSEDARRPAPTAENLTVTMAPGAGNWGTHISFTGNHANATDITKYEFFISHHSNSEGSWTPLTPELLASGVEYTVIDSRYKVFLRLKADGDTPASRATRGVQITNANVKPGPGPSISSRISYNNESLSVYATEVVEIYVNGALWASYAGKNQTISLTTGMEIRARALESQKLPASEISITAPIERGIVPLTPNVTVRLGDDVGCCYIYAAIGLEFKVVVPTADADATGDDVIYNWRTPSYYNVRSIPGAKIYVRTAAVYGSATTPGLFASAPCPIPFIITEDQIRQPVPLPPTTEELGVTLSRGTLASSTLVSFSGSLANPADIVNYEIQVASTLNTYFGAWTRLTADNAVSGYTIADADARKFVFLRRRADGNIPTGLATEGIQITKANIKPDSAPDISSFVDFINETLTVYSYLEYSLVSAAFPDVAGNIYGSPIPVSPGQVIFMRYRETDALPAGETGSYTLPARPAAPNVTQAVTVSRGPVIYTSYVRPVSGYEWKAVKATADANATGADVIQDWTTASGSYIRVSAGDKVYARRIAVSGSEGLFRSHPSEAWVILLSQIR